MQPNPVQSIFNMSTIKADAEVSTAEVSTAEVSTAEVSKRLGELSLFIPRVFPNITEERIRQVFLAKNYGEVDHVDFVAKVDKVGKKYNSAYVHFNGNWFWNDVSIAFREQVCFHSETQIRLVYDEPWYWIVLENTAVKEEEGSASCSASCSPLLTSILEKQRQARMEGVKTNLLGKLVLDKISGANNNVAMNLVSEDYVKHIEEMNADLLDKIQFVSEDYVRQIEEMNTDLLEKVREQAERIKWLETMCGSTEITLSPLPTDYCESPLSSSFSSSGSRPFPPNKYKMVIDELATTDASAATDPKFVGWL